VPGAKLSHLACAPEIAQLMLRRQPAEAIASARRKIVQGAVGMVSNLRVVLCSVNEAQPVVDTGTPYG
jgi:hypothetical protein